MERMTEWIGNKPAIREEDNMHPWELASAYRSAIRRLALYEDTRLEPLQAKMLSCRGIALSFFGNLSLSLCRRRCCLA